MSNLFAGLESIGLGGFSEAQLFEHKEKEKNNTVQAQKTAEVTENDLLFDKTFVCPVCDKEFKTRFVRAGKVKLLGQDSDLRPRYQHVDALKYDAIVCPACGYAALNRFFPNMTSTHARLIKESISTTFRGITEPAGIFTYDDAIIRHKLALLNTAVKHARASEKAYTCLKLAWLLRGKSETLPADTPNIEIVKKELYEQEREFLENAYEGFTEAFSKEEFPMCGMNEITITYLVADLARQIGKHSDALRMLARVLISKDANDRIKEKAREMKEKIQEEAKKN